jgi:2,3-dihydroxybenzoate decarboxylase
MVDNARRTLLRAGGLLAAAGAAPGLAQGAIAGKPRLIAVEEAWACPQWMDEMRKLPAAGLEADEVAAFHVLSHIGDIHVRLVDMDLRLKTMDEHGVDMHLLSLTAPGVQSFAPDLALRVARLTNDRLATIVRENPRRYAALASVPPQDVPAAVAEIRRARRELGLNGVIINSHTRGEYLDDRKYWPIFEAAVETGAPVYIHPRTPNPQMAPLFKDYALWGAIYGYGAETGLHLIRLISSGVFDAYPDLKVVVGHMGEGLPYWFYRIDHMHKNMVTLAKTPMRPILKRLPSEYFRSNIAITTSGVNWHEALTFARRTVGADNIMFAIDYPYERTEDAVGFIRSAPLEADDMAKIAHRNAERIFGIAAA